MCGCGQQWPQLAALAVPVVQTALIRSQVTTYGCVYVAGASIAIVTTCTLIVVQGQARLQDLWGTR